MSETVNPSNPQPVSDPIQPTPTPPELTNFRPDTGAEPPFDSSSKPQTSQSPVTPLHVANSIQPSLSSYTGSGYIAPSGASSTIPPMSPVKRPNAFRIPIILVVIFFSGLVGSLNRLIFVGIAALLGDPAAGTTARAAANISTFVVVGLEIIILLVLGSVLVARGIKEYRANQVTAGNTPRQPISPDYFMLISIAIIIVVSLVLYFLVVPKYGEMHPEKYTESDLVTQTETGYSYSRPKSWEKANKVKEIDAFIEGKDSGRTIAFADDIFTDTKGVNHVKNAFVASAPTDAPIPGDNDTVRQTLLDHRGEFEKLVKKNITADTIKGKSGICASVENITYDFTYSKNDFVFTVIISADCMYSDSAKKELGSESVSEHMLTLLGQKNNKAYEWAVVANKASWDKNKDTFTKMANSFKAH